MNDRRRERFSLVALAPDATVELASALVAAGLPGENLDRPENLFFRFEQDGAVLGYAGLEIYGDAAILRSVVILEGARGHGSGRRLVAATLDRAAALGVRSIFLLTMTAAGFFARLGFRPITRDGVPKAIAAAPEFERLCPASAICMMRAL